MNIETVCKVPDAISGIRKAYLAPTFEKLGAEQTLSGPIYSGVEQFLTTGAPGAPLNPYSGPYGASGHPNSPN